MLQVFCWDFSYDIYFLWVFFASMIHAFFLESKQRFCWSVSLSSFESCDCRRRSSFSEMCLVSSCCGAYCNPRFHWPSPRVFSRFLFPWLLVFRVRTFLLENSLRTGPSVEWLCCSIWAWRSRKLIVRHYWLLGMPCSTCWSLMQRLLIFQNIRYYNYY